VSTHFLEAVSKASPILRVSPAGSPYKPVAPVERPPPLVAEGGLLSGATTRSRQASLDALAAAKSKSGTKKKRQAARRKEAKAVAGGKAKSSGEVSGKEGADAPLAMGETVADAKFTEHTTSDVSSEHKEVKAEKEVVQRQ
jgi:hypothetical protein